MPLTLLLVLLGAFTVDVDAAAAPRRSFLEAENPEPLVLWNPAPRVRQWLRVGSAPLSTTSSTIPQLTNRRTGVTCSMRILAVKPVPDPGIFASVSGPHPDLIVGRGLSPCVE